MLVEVVSKYLLTNKRLVVPNLGTFIVKKAGESVLFSNLMKSDDGVLRHLLVEQGISELEAAGLIDRFVFEVNYRLQNRGECLISGFGRLIAGANGSVTFEYSATAEGENLEGRGSVRQAPSKSVVAEPVAKESEAESQPQVTEHNNTTAEKVVISEPEDRPEPANRPAPKKTDTAEAARRVRPEKYAKGLRYGKGRKVVTGRESATARRSSKGDIIIKIAILVASLAIMALLYGLYNDWQAGKIGFFGNNEPTSQVEIVNDIFEDAPDEVDGMRNPDLDYITPKN